MGWEVYPAGLTEVLEFVASRTGDLPLYVTESGAAYPLDDLDPTLDPERVSFLRRHLVAASTAMEHGVPLRGYFVWSLLDNFEWAHGYAHRFGIIHVDFDTLERRVRDSATFWSAVARSGVLPADGSGSVVAVDRQTRLGIEEVEPGHVDHEVDRLTLRRGGSRAQPGEELGMIGVQQFDGLELVVTHVVRELLRVLGDHGRRVHREMHDDVRAEGLPQVDDRSDPTVLRRLGNERGVLDVLRPQPDDHRSALEPPETRMGGHDLWRHPQSLPAELDTPPTRWTWRAWPPPCSWRVTR